MRNALPISTRKPQVVAMVIRKRRLQIVIALADWNALALFRSRGAPTSFPTPTEKPSICCNVCATQRGHS